METLTRRFNNTFGTWSGFKHTLRHGKSLSSIIGPISVNVHSSEDTMDRMDTRSSLHLLGHNRTASAASGQGSIGSGTSRSISMNSISSEGSNETPMVEQEDIIALTQDVRVFKDALGRLRRIFHPDRDRHETVRVTAHEKLGEVLRILRNILEKYGPLQSTELLMAAGQLIQQIKGFNFEDEKTDPTEFFEAIDQLALAFSSRVSEYLMGDLDTSSAVHPAARTRSCENLSESDGISDGRINKIPEVLSSQQIDETLMRLEHGVGVALQRAKVWSKYSKDVMTYIEKRSSLEAEYSRNIIKLAQAMKPILKEDNFLPFQSVYCSAVDQDSENASHSQATCNLLLGHKFIEPLNARRNEHEKTRKHIKETWQRELKKMQDAVNNLRKARTLYYQRQQEYEKARESLQRIESLEGTETSKLDKKKRLEDDALQKAMEAETTYKACVVEANERHQNLQKVKAEVLKQIRELILQCDQTMKAVTVGYFQLQHTVSAPAPVQFQTLCESSRLYEPGSQYMEYVKRLPVHCDAPVIEPPPFSFEPYVPTDSRLQDRERKLNGILENSEDQASSTDHKERKPMKLWSQTGMPLTISDSDSISSQSNKSVDTSPFSSPQISNRHLMSAPGISHEEFDLDTDSLEVGEFPSKQLSKAAITHSFRKLKTPSRCRECDCYVYFQGMECTECGLTCHRKCAETLAIQCGHKRLKPKLTTFGVDLTSHVQETQTNVPHIVSRCIREIDSRGKNIKGIYRVSGVKSRVEKLCQSFENGAELVDLTEIHPNVIANVVKLYFRQLPEPLLTFRLYPDFVQIAKKYPGRAYDMNSVKDVIEELQVVVQKLPPPHFATLALLMTHLKQVSENSDLNNMPASNLGIVFGPTLLRTSEGSASLSSLIDTVHQTRVVELLIMFAQDLFGDSSPKCSSVISYINTDLPSAVIEVNQDTNTSEEYEHFNSQVKRNSTEDVSGNLIEESTVVLNSDDELPDSLLPDYSTTDRSLLFPYYPTHQIDDINPSSDLRVNVSNDPTDTNLNSENSEEFLKMHDEMIPEKTEELSERGFPSVPVPPPRRYSSQSKLSRSPCPSESDSISIGSTSSGNNPAAEVNFADRIVIHVQSEDSSDKLTNEIKTENSVPKCRPIVSVVDVKPPKDFEEVNNNACSPVSKPLNQNSNEDIFPSRSEPPVPSPRLRRALMTTGGSESGFSMENSKLVSHHQTYGSESSINTSTEGLSPGSTDIQQPSPISSVPSTTSSLDELEEFSSGDQNVSPVMSEYISPYLTDPYKNIRMGPGSPLTYARTSTFANYDKTGNVSNVVLESDEGEFKVAAHNRTAVRSISYPLNELGSRNSVLRTATRYQRYSPAYSTASTKSSGSSSPPLDYDEVGEIVFIDSCRPSPRPIPRTSVLSSQEIHTSASSDLVSNESSVFLRSTEDESDAVLHQKKSVESNRAPRFV